MRALGVRSGKVDGKGDASGEDMPELLELSELVGDGREPGSAGVMSRRFAMRIDERRGVGVWDGKPSPRPPWDRPRERRRPTV
jgi:hypothetical protein